jgi:competence protein ComGC
MIRLLALSILLCLPELGCSKRSPAPQPEISAETNEGPAAVVAESDLASVLKELTQGLRRFSAEKQGVPASLDALVAAGYIQHLPQPPAGKVFAIDAKNVQVIVK